MGKLSQVNRSLARRDAMIDHNKSDLEDPSFYASPNLRSEIDMWTFIYCEISNLRLECSRLASYVRMNTKSSPNYLNAYWSHLYALLIPASVLIEDRVWRKIDTYWLETKKEINLYFRDRRVSPNKRIPFSLIRRLDKLYRVILLILQKKGMGIRTSEAIESHLSIEDAIAGK